MSKILVDFYRLKDVHSGLGYFSKQLSKFLVAGNSDRHLTFLIPKSFVSTFALLCQTEIFSFKLKFFPQMLSMYDIWHSTTQFPSILPPQGKSKFVLTIHDLNFLYEKTESKQKKYKRRLQRLVNRADTITAISHFTKSNIEKHLVLDGKKVHVIHNGVDSPELTNSQKPHWMSGESFFFAIGYFTKKKNWEPLIHMMTEFPKHKLVISGFNDTQYGTRCKQIVVELGLENKVILSGTISNKEKSWLFANCTAFFFPSTAEGFGMPAVEAMKMGKPTFLSKYTSLPEIGGDAAFYFNGFEKNEMKLVVESGLKVISKDPKKMAKKIKEHAKKFDWQTAAKQYLTLYDNLLL